MQNSSTAFKLDLPKEQENNNEQKVNREFGDVRKQKTAQTQQSDAPKVLTHVVEEQVVYIKGPDADLDEELQSKYVPQLNYLAPPQESSKPLLRVLVGDVLSHFITYSLIVVATVLAVYKVILVQQTRDMNIKLNDVNQRIDILNNEWLSLLSERELLTEYTVIRQAAAEKLDMVQPKTEDEVVIDLR